MGVGKRKTNRLQPFSYRVVLVVKAIPRKRVLTYGGVARLAGNPLGARQVGRLLHSLSRRFRLPWQRVVGAGGRIALRDPHGRGRQLALLRAEGVEFSDFWKINLNRYGWQPSERIRKKFALGGGNDPDRQGS
jgi:methylated-DNA-protein-cysteine methyltransferase-like protein